MSFDEWRIELITLSMLRVVFVLILMNRDWVDHYSCRTMQMKDNNPIHSKDVHIPYLKIKNPEWWRFWSFLSLSRSPLSEWRVRDRNCPERLWICFKYFVNWSKNNSCVDFGKENFFDFNDRSLHDELLIKCFRLSWRRERIEGEGDLPRDLLTVVAKRAWCKGFGDVFVPWGLRPFVGLIRDLFTMGCSWKITMREDDQRRLWIWSGRHHC